MSHSHMTMDSDTSSSDSSTSAMSMVFTNAHDAPLFSSSWTPASTGAYAGTCIFLICLAVVFRLLLAFKARVEARWLDAELNRRYVVVAGKPTLAQQVAHDADTKRLVLSENGIEEDVMVLRAKKHTQVRPWRLSVDPVRALLDTVITGVGYLLMLGAMTMNVGYFMSILGGTFLGSLAVGRYTGLVEH